MTTPAGRTGGPHLHIGRLALRVSGVDEGEARELGRLVAAELASGTLRVTAGDDLGRVRIEVTTAVAEAGRPDLLARRISGELGRVLERDQQWEAP
jgi:hypothetical protein